MSSISITVVEMLWITIEVEYFSTLGLNFIFLSLPYQVNVNQGGGGGVDVVSCTGLYSGIKAGVCMDEENIVNLLALSFNTADMRWKGGLNFIREMCVEGNDNG